MSEMSIDVVKPVENQSLEGKIHSITFYVPKKKNKFVSEALKEVSKSDYGNTSTTGKVSKYLRSLLKKDFIARGLYDVDGEPIPEALENLKKNNAKTD